MKMMAMATRRRRRSCMAAAATAGVVMVLVVLMNGAALCEGGATSNFVRKLEESEDMPLDSDTFYVPPGRNAPQQVHITQGDHDGRAVLVSWVTPDQPGSHEVVYWKEDGGEMQSAMGIITRYKYYNYTSGFIHHCTISNLDYDTKYYYRVGTGKTARTFWFTTPPPVGPDAPYTFGLIGDLGQTYDSNATLTHYQNNPLKGQTLLFVGDLSYADDHPFHDNRRWDSWGRFTERSVAYQPWIWTAGNHELDFAPELEEFEPFKPFAHRYHVPFRASGSTARFWYSVKRASAYIIVLSSYSAYGKYTPQYEWLLAELPKVNRSETPWLIVLMHSPWYNSNNYHYMEGETMRVIFESWFVQYKVDAVFAGHVHAYERSVSAILFASALDPIDLIQVPKFAYNQYTTDQLTIPLILSIVLKNVQERVSNIAYNITNKLCTPIKNENAPVYITIGDGGNIEGLANNLTEPQPSYSAYREASFGHAIFSIKNRTHADYRWHRNQDGKYTPQYEWLLAELPKVNRSETPWLIVLMHSPWYNSNNYHYMEGETMRVMFESWFVQYKVDAVFAGHVHAYERSERVSNIAYNITNKLCTPIKNENAPVYITIGDGGNIEGLANNLTEPQPSYSAYREASFGHAIFSIKNRTHAYYGWHRNQDGYAVKADQMWFFNRYWYPADDSTTAES
ncbi:Purple acid phosphatase 10-like protein [Drosera capensis]